jgi:hypothetical protein
MLAWIAAVTALSALLLAAPNVIALPGPHDPVAVAAALASFGAMLALSYRQLRLYWVGELSGTLVGALGLALVGITSIQWVGDHPYGAGFWLLHLIDTAGVLAACLAVAMGHRTERRVSEVLLPVLERDPLAAMEVGMAPVVRRFVAALAEKDAITRDHVVRVGELAMRAGERSRLGPRRLRHLGLAAILHDVGKLTVSDEILKKPGRLTSEEFERMKRHTIDGERLLRSTPGLEQAARFVRSHHERVDGRGYPDALAKNEIPLEARIIAASDGYDAMASTRHYREGLGGATRRHRFSRSTPAASGIHRPLRPSSPSFASGASSVTSSTGWIASRITTPVTPASTRCRRRWSSCSPRCATDEAAS